MDSWPFQLAHKLQNCLLQQWVSSGKQTMVVPPCIGRPRERIFGSAAGQRAGGDEGGSEVGTVVASPKRPATSQWGEQCEVKHRNSQGTCDNSSPSHGAGPRPNQEAKPVGWGQQGSRPGSSRHRMTTWAEMHLLSEGGAAPRRFPVVLLPLVLSQQAVPRSWGCTTPEAAMITVNQALGQGKAVLWALTSTQPARHGQSG